MQFDQQLLKEYQQLLQTTELVRCYQEFIRLFRYLRIELEKELPICSFQGKITENAMDYSYFQFTSPSLKEKGLKLVVVFIHRTICFELWLSGYNRKQQCEFHQRCIGGKVPYQLSQNAEKTDYILRKSFPQFDLCSNEQTVLQCLKEESLKMISLFERF